MNFFFGIKNKYLSCTLTIPKFQNNGLKKNDYKVYAADIKNASHLSIEETTIASYAPPLT